MSDSLKMNYLFSGHQLTVNEAVQEQNLDLKIDRSLSDLKKTKRTLKLFFKISALKWKSIFFIVNFPM